MIANHAETSDVIKPEAILIYQAIILINYRLESLVIIL